MTEAVSASPDGMTKGHFIAALALCSATASAENNVVKKNGTKIEGRSFLLSAISGIGSCPPCPCGYGSIGVSGVGPAIGSGAVLGSGAGHEHGKKAAGLSGTAVHTSGTGISGAVLHNHGLGSGLNVGHGTPVVVSGASVTPEIRHVAPGAVRDQGLVTGGGAGLLGIPIVSTPGIGAGVGASEAAAATGHSGSRSASGFVNKAGGHKAGQGRFAYNVGDSDSSSHGHRSLYGDSKNFGGSASEGSSRAQGQGSHGSAFNKQAAGSEASNHISGTNTKVSG
ncbi:uncharacterized protein [Dermacentor albipictus]|uniref:uncharacterized protein n=1 Tax=Dermacentor albipictus TaxID=60249 RepID=UPI0031FD7286